MSDTLKQLLKWKGVGMILLNSKLGIVETHNIATTMLRSIDEPFPGKVITDIFPELIGNEQTLREVIEKKTPGFHLDYVNRTDSKGDLRFLNMLLLPDEESGGGILFLEDVTELAGLIQEYHQQKYDLLLYESSLRLKKEFLRQSVLGQSPPMQEVRVRIEKLSSVPRTTILLLGESGTGKNLAARVIHYSSMPPDAPFVDINCAALPENLLESELFGYEKGAFTDAKISRPGLFEEAAGGTVFLDEIGELPLSLQAKLLSVLEDKKFRRLGSNKPVEVQARIIAATNRDLKKYISKRKFREDLYYRLNVVSITMPPLRAMGQDILIIADHFLNIFNAEFKKKVKGFTKSAERTLTEHTWPGNVRELSNCLERAMIFVEGDWIDEPDLVISLHESRGHTGDLIIPSTGISLEEVERRHIVAALNKSGGNKSKAARLLGLSRDTLRYRLEKHGLE